MKTEGKGFYIDAGEDKLSGYGDNSKKSTEIGSVASNQQLPLLLYNQQNSSEDSSRKHTLLGGKKKPQIVMQKQTFNIKQIINYNK